MCENSTIKSMDIKNGSPLAHILLQEKSSVELWTQSYVSGKAKQSNATIF
jgi:hypothetical protein